MASNFHYMRPVSPLVLADRLLTLAQDADRAGYLDAASQLVSLMYSVLDEPAPAPSFTASWTRPVSEPASQPGQFRRPNESLGRTGQPHV